MNCCTEPLSNNNNNKQFHFLDTGKFLILHEREEQKWHQKLFDGASFTMKPSRDCLLQKVPIQSGKRAIAQMEFGTMSPRALSCAPDWRREIQTPPRQQIGNVVDRESCVWCSPQ
jgi:hypothetical protein